MAGGRLGKHRCLFRRERGKDIDRSQPFDDCATITITLPEFWTLVVPAVFEWDRRS